MVNLKGVSKFDNFGGPWEEISLLVGIRHLLEAYIDLKRSTKDQTQPGNDKHLPQDTMTLSSYCTLLNHNVITHRQPF